MRHLKTIFILVTTTFLVGITSCKKESKFTSADVFVYEKGANKPMAGIPVNFGYATSGVFSGWVVEQSKPTDANGKVSFKAQKEDKSYSVGFPNGADYFGDGADLKQGENNRIFLEAGLFAYVRVHAKNVNPFDNNDWISISNGGLGGGVLYGMNVDTTVVRGPFKGTGNEEFGWVVKKNNISTTYTVQLYFVGRDTINYTIEY